MVSKFLNFITFFVNFRGEKTQLLVEKTHLGLKKPAKKLKKKY